MDPLQPNQLDKIFEVPETDWEDTKAPMKRETQLIDSKAAFESVSLNSKENTSGGTKHLNESFTFGSCTLLEDVETPSSFNSSTICVEKILSLSDGSSQDSKDKILEISSGCVNDFSPRTPHCNDGTSYLLLAESEKVLEALEDNKAISFKNQSSPVSKLNFLDLDNLNDSLLADFTQFMGKENELQDLDGPSMSTPKNFEKSNIKNLSDDCKTNLNFNGTFSKDPIQKENVFCNDENVDVPSKLNFNGTFAKSPMHIEHPRSNDENLEIDLEAEEHKKENKVVNTTYNAQTNEIKETVMNLTTEVGSPMKSEEPLNKTFEVVGNGSFIIDGQCTTLMDMESNALNTVLGSASNTPVSRGTRSYPDVKKLDKSTLKKRLSMINYQMKDDITSTITERSNQTSTAENREENDDKTLPSSKIDSQNMLKNQLTKEQILNRLRKNNHPTPSSAVCGPMKAIPIASVYNSSKGQLNQIQEVEKRAASTPTGIPKENDNQFAKSDEKERLLSLPSFGSVSSIGTDGPNSKDICSDDFMATPEVFRHRNKSLAAHITSTPTIMSSSNIKFETDLGLGSVPTPILPPKAPIIKSIKTERNVNNSFVCQAKKEPLDIGSKGRLSFATSSEGGSPDSIKEENKSKDNVLNMANNEEIDECVSFSKDNSKMKTLIKEEKDCEQISKQTSAATAVNNLESDICQISVRESEICSSSHSAAKDLKDVECGTIFTSTAKEEIDVQKIGFSNYMNEAERKFEQLDNITDKVCSEDNPISTNRDLSLGFSDCTNVLPNGDLINSVQVPDANILPDANEMIATNERLCEDNSTNEVHNSINEIKSETVDTEKSGKNQKFQPDVAKDENTINKTLKSKEVVVKNASRASLSKVTNLANKAINPSSRVTLKPLSSTKRLSHQPATKVERKFTPSLTKSANSRVSTPRYSGSQPRIPAVKPLNTTERNPTPAVTKSANSRVSTPRCIGSQPVRLAVKPLNTSEITLSVKKGEPHLKQETQSKIKPQLPTKPLVSTKPQLPTKLQLPIKPQLPRPAQPQPPTKPIVSTKPQLPTKFQLPIKPQLPRPALKSLNARTLPTPKVKNKLLNSVSDLPKLPTTARTLPIPKVENNQQKSVSDQSKIPSNNSRSSLASSRSTFSSSNKENNSLQSHLPRKSFIGSGIRPPMSRTGIPLPRAVSNR